VGLGGQFALLPLRDRLAGGDPPRLAALSSLLTLVAVVGFVLFGPRLVAAVGRAAARVSRTVPSLLAARRIADSPQSAFASVAAVGLAAIALAYVGCTVAVARGPGVAADRMGFPMRPGVVTVMTGGVPRATVEPLLTQGGVAVGGSTGFVVPCADLARVARLTCPYRPGSDFVEPPAGTSPAGVVGLVHVPTDGSLAAENRVRTEAANLVPNAIINSSRDPIDYNLETFFQDLDRLAAVAALFVLIVGAFGLAASTVGGLIDRRRPFALLRTAGVYLGELRRAVLLETAATMAVVSVVGTVIGMVLAYGSTVQGDVRWRWPGLEVYGLIGGAVLAALVFSAIALPLLTVTTRHDAVRFE
jgi:hypothetical protein